MGQRGAVLAPPPRKELTMELRYKMLDILPLLSVPQPPIGRSSYNIPCPLCDHPNTRDGHLNINLRKNVFRCSKCGEFYGGVFDLYAYFMNIAHQDVLPALQVQLGECDSHIYHAGKRKKRSAPVRKLKAVEIPQATLADIEVRDHTYRTLLDLLALDADHKENLLRRGLNEKEIVRLQYRSTPLVGFRTIAKTLMMIKKCQLYAAEKISDLCCKFYAYVGCKCVFQAVYFNITNEKRSDLACYSDRKSVV